MSIFLLILSLLLSGCDLGSPLFPPPLPYGYTYCW